ncbi:MAG: hypothetical protein LBN40_05815 [Oscillospiraceae bacterium]|jgi:hypothetical protein|nr:hypothetical protein [Oscillospiraceae bacterium]
MVKLIPGKKGSGKTKLLVSAIHAAAGSSNGNVVAIQVGKSLNENITHSVRLINIEDYAISNYETLYGFFAGILASDYDCTHVFTDGLLKIAGKDYDKAGEFFGKLSQISSDCAELVFTISADENDLPESVKKYFAK